LCNEELLQWEWELHIKGIPIRFPDMIFARFGSYEEAVIAAAQCGLEVSPRSIQRGCKGSSFLVVLDAFMEEYSLKLSKELRARRRFFKEIAAEAGGLNFFAEFFKSLFAVNEALHHGSNGMFDLRSQDSGILSG
jgi:hypothetical protein